MQWNKSFAQDVQLISTIANGVYSTTTHEDGKHLGRLTGCDPDKKKISSTVVLIWIQCGVHVDC